MTLIGAKLSKVEKGFCEITLPYSLKLTQQDQFLHAGVVGTIADSACGYAAYTLMGKGEEVLSIEFKLNLLSPAKADLFIAQGRVIKPGKTITVCEAKVIAKTGTKKKLCATATVTLIAIKRE